VQASAPSKKTPAGAALNTAGLSQPQLDFSPLSIDPERHQAQYLWALSESVEKANAFRGLLTWDQLASALSSGLAEMVTGFPDRNVSTRMFLEQLYHEAVQCNAATRGPHTPEMGKLAARFNDEI
jgi:hypothetical protein